MKPEFITIASVLVFTIVCLVGMNFKQMVVDKYNELLGKSKQFKPVNDSAFQAAALALIGFSAALRAMAEAQRPIQKRKTEDRSQESAFIGSAGPEVIETAYGKKYIIPRPSFGQLPPSAKLTNEDVTKWAEDLKRACDEITAKNKATRDGNGIN